MRNRWFALMLGMLLGLTSATVVLGTNDLGFTTGTNTILTIRQWYLAVQTANAVSFNNTNSVDPTDLTTQTCTQNNNVSCSLKEVNIEDSDFGDVGWVGEQYCASWQTPYTVCDYGSVLINQYYGPYTDNVMRSIVCQEVGHAMGLDHHATDTTSCMLELSPPWPVYLNTHDKNLINSKY